MDSFEFNKIAGGVLAACLFVMVLGMVSNGLVHASKPEKPVFEEVAASDHKGGGPAPSAAPVALEPVGPLLAKADPAKGQVAFEKRCGTCHIVTATGPVKQGPPLWEVVGRDRGTVAGFAYSDAMKAKHDAWNYDTINEFIAKPAAYVKGTKMAFVGVPNAAERADIIAYLRAQSASPKPLPQ